MAASRLGAFDTVQSNLDDVADDDDFTIWKDFDNLLPTLWHSGADRVVPDGGVGLRDTDAQLHVVKCDDALMLRECGAALERIRGSREPAALDAFAMEGASQLGYRPDRTRGGINMEELEVTFGHYELELASATDVRLPPAAATAAAVRSYHSPLLLAAAAHHSFPPQPPTAVLRPSRPPLPPAPVARPSR